MNKINPKLVNIAVVLVIVCAVAFIVLWAVPTFTQKAGDVKNQAATAIENSQYSLSSAKAFLAKVYEGPKIEMSETTPDGYSRSNVRYEEVMAIYSSKGYKAFYFIHVRGTDFRGLEADCIIPVWVAEGSNEWQADIP